MVKIRTLLSLCIFASLCSFSPAWGAWSESGLNLCASYVQTYPALLSASQGQTIVAWYDSRGINAQRYDSFGNELWGSCGTALCTETSMKTNLVIASDGADGAFVVWVDVRSGNMDLYAQRVNASGVPQWSMSGVAISTAANSQYSPQIIADGSGGAYATWEDNRFSLADWNIYIARLNASGLQWSNVIVCNYTAAQRSPFLASDGAGGAIIAWQDLRNGNTDIYAQRMNGSTPMWTANGVPVCNESHTQQAAQITADGVGGAIIDWGDDRASDWDLYAQRVNSGGTMQWTANGVAVCSVTGQQNFGRLISDGQEGAFIVWQDFRSGNMAVYAQRMSAAGAALWTSGGSAISPQYGYSPDLTSDCMGGIVVSWSDVRVGSNINIYAQRLNASGNAYWQAGGVPVCTAAGEQAEPLIVSDGSGGGVTVWRDYRTETNYYYYVQRVDRNGYWGYPCPTVEAVRDVPGDQGGYVNLAWNASRLDPWPNQLITYYSLWKAIDQAQLFSLLKTGAMLLASPGEMMREVDKPVVRMELAPNQTFYWELVATQSANYYETYSKKLATDFDSTAVCDEQHYFQVCAHSADPKVCWTSPPDSGYSVDNLAPVTPVGLAGEQSFVPEGLTLSWDRNSESDFGTYAVYRGTDESFEPSSENLIVSTCDTLLFDGEWRWDSGFSYKISALDIHGNESGYALLTPESVTGVETPAAPAVTRLAQNVPNPFNPMTRIAFELATPGHASLRIYDSAGRLVRTLVESDWSAGRHIAIWDGRDTGGRQAASGMYFYRLTAGQFEQTKKMVLLR